MLFPNPQADNIQETLHQDVKAKHHFHGVTPGCEGKTPLSWTGKYKSAYLASATRLIEDADKLWLDGQNSAGLSVGALYFDGYAQYPSELVGDECSNGISHVQMINYILSK